MKIVCTGTETQQQELRAKLNEIDVSYVNEINFNEANLNDFDVIIDLNFDSRQQNLLDFLPNQYSGLVILGNIKYSLYTLPKQENYYIVGLNHMSGFINKPLWEMTYNNQQALEKWSELSKQLSINFQMVDDRVGLVSPRVICMIINEAYYTVQEGSASKEDIDLAMKLGTSYPYGPFEWSQIIGLKNVYDILEAVYQDTHDERYKICPLLKREAIIL